MPIKFVMSDDSIWIFQSKMRLLVALLMVWMAPFGALAQEQYKYTTEGYACEGRDRDCSAYALYRTFQAGESVAQVAGYFNVTPASVTELSGLDPTIPLPKGKALYIPLDCRCRESTSQMYVPHTIVQGDSFTSLAATPYGGLTTYQAMVTANPMMEVNAPVVDDTIDVPIFCACPTEEQIANRVKFLLTYGVYAFNETLESISAKSGVAVAEVGAANQLPVEAVPENHTNVLLPLQTLPPLEAMDFPTVIPPPIPLKENLTSSSSSGRSKAGIIAGTTAGAVAVLLLAVGCLLLPRRGFVKKEGEFKSGFSQLDPDLPVRMFTYKELKRATKRFRKSELLGSGGFGAVYKGTLPSGALVAVKRLRMESKHGKESFRAEVTSLSRIRHRNLVQLRGWCHEEEQLLLVYDFMCNGSLDEWLFQFSEKGNKRGTEALPLKSRHSILSGVASALAYLHEECPQCVLHRDIKSSNVLLDAEMNAYLGDFGLARLIDHQKMARTTMMAGTLGYLAPEMPHTGKATKETDVYSFGVLMLEVMCGREPLDVDAVERGEGVLEDMVWRAHEAGNILQAADSKLGTFSSDSDTNSSSNSGGFESTSEALTLRDQIVDHSALDCEFEERKMITNLLQLGLLCCHPSPEARPPMRVVSQLMQCKSWEDMEMAMPCLPEWKPHVHYFRPPGFSQVSL